MFGEECLIVLVSEFQCLETKNTTSGLVLGNKPEETNGTSNGNGETWWHPQLSFIFYLPTI